MIKTFLLLPFSIMLLSCNNAELKKEIRELKEQNEILKKSTPDSLSIYKSFKENKEQQYTEKFLDSLRLNNPKLYKKIQDEFMYEIFLSGDISASPK